MAERRMLTKKVTNNDNFTELPATAQALYLHLVMNADDDGFCDQASTAIFRAHAKKKDLEALIQKRYLLRFDSGVLVIKHWRMGNTLRKDRYEPTAHQEEFKKLTLKSNGAYTLVSKRQPDDNQPDAEAEPAGQPNDGQSGNQMTPERQPDGNQPVTQVRLGKDRVGKDRIITGDMCVNARAREREADDGFEAFWNAYPRKVGGSIQEAYMEYLHVTADLGVPPATLIAAAREQGKELTRETARYFPGAEKWLRNRGWEQQKPQGSDAETNNVFLQIYNEEHSG